MTSGGLPRYVQLAAIIREMITSGALDVGDHAPSENELTDTHHVSRYTASRALDLLAAEGLIERRTGTGSIVIRVPEPPAEIRAGPGARVRARMPTRPEVQRGMPPGEPVLVITREGRPDEIHPAGHTVILTVR